MTPFVFKTMKEEDCKIYSDELFTFHAKNKTKHDNRCPGSDALYGAPKHKEIHEELALKLSSVINIRLAPTFVYSRIYRPGEILYPHTDRAECEYTASLTLDYSDNNSWEIFVKDYENSVMCFTPNKGDSVVFKGNTMSHWRGPFKGKWQTQSIFSFIDLDGDRSHLANDPKNNHVVTE